MHYANFTVIMHEKIPAYAGLEGSPVEAKYYEASAYPSELAGPSYTLLYIHIYLHLRCRY